MKYMIILYSEVTDEMVDNAVERSRDNLRHSIQGEDRVILKYSGSDPACFDGYTKYNHSEILEIVRGEDWTAPEEII